MKHLIFILLLSCSVGFSAQAQKDYSAIFSEKDNFLKDGEHIMNLSSNRKVADSIWREFTPIWTSLMDSAQQADCLTLARNMYEKGYKPSPHFENLFASIAFGVKSERLGPIQLSQFMLIADTVCRIYKKPVFPNFLTYSRYYLEKGKLYDSRFSNCEIKGAKVTFGHAIDPQMLEDGLTFQDAGFGAGIEEEIFPDFDSLEILKAEAEAKAKADEEAKKAKAKKDKPKKDDDGWDTGGDDGWDTGGDDGWDTSADDGWDTSSDDGWDVEESSDDGWAVDTVGTSIWKEGVGGKTMEEFIDTLAFKSRWEEERALGKKGSSLFVASVMPRPAIKGPFLDIQNTDFILSSVYDTFQISQTSGQFMLKNGEFIGVGGKANWQSVGLDSADVNAEFSEYNVNVRRPEMFAEAVQLTYKSRLEKSTPGIFIYKIDSRNGKPNAIYPAFISYFNDIDMTGLAEGVRFQGGLTLNGNRISSKSLSGGDSKLWVEKGDTLKFRLTTPRDVSFKDSTISTEKADIVIYHNSGKDSISNKGMTVRYHAGKQVLRARKDKEGYKYSPFKASYHKIEFVVDYLQWDLNADSLDVTMLNARDKVPMEIESYDYFNLETLARLSGFYGFNPVQVAVLYARKVNGTHEFYSAELAEKYKLKPRSVKTAMQEIERLGYVNYNPVTDLVELDRKAMLYAYANSKLVDYDNIKIYSISGNKKNASLKLDSDDLVVEGVKGFTISDSMKVQVAPTGEQITIQKNRDTKFSGQLRSGSFVYKGTDFKFNYDTFVVNMPLIDEVSIILADTATGKDVEIPNGLVGTSGQLFISQPKNKSALKPHNGYPKFSTDKAASIYFGGDEILGGAYKNDTNIVFDIPPFAIDSLNSSDPNAINFDGTFKSGGIFPDMEEKVSIMPDKSLGFKTQTPQDGYQLYAKKLKEEAKFYNDITLDNNGIRGNGKMEYLSGTFKGEDFIFFSDSVKTGRPGSEGEILAGDYKGVSFPSVKMEKFDMSWYVNNDSMVLKSVDKDFEIYNSSVSFQGILALTPDALNGNGNFETKRAKTYSKSFTFKENEYDSKNAAFLVKSDNPKKPAMIGENINVHYDFKNKYADMKSEKSGDRTLRFPDAQYATNLENAHWDFEKQTIDISVSSTDQLATSKFISTNPAQDGLEFNAERATYDLKDNTINAEGVPFIRVANVMIKPKDGKVIVRENANMDRLEDCTIIMNAFTKYHTLTGGNVKIKSRKSFDGSATYAYKNEAGEAASILFESFDVKINKDKNGNETFVTTAEAKITEAEKFPAFAGILYQGTVKLVDYEQHLEFGGLVTPDLRREHQWFTYVSQDTSTQGKIFVDANTRMASSNNKLLTGLFLGIEDKEIYGSFLEYDRKTEGAFPMFQVSGLLTYETASKNYTISPQTRRRGLSDKGNRMVYNDDKLEINAQGLFNLTEINKDFLVQTGAHGDFKLETRDYKLDGLIHIKFEGNPQAFEQMAIDLKETLQESAPIEYSRKRLYSNLSQIISEGDLEKFTQNNTTSGDFTMARMLADGITFPQVELKWSDLEKAFYSEGKITVSNLFKNDADVTMEGYIEIPKYDNNKDVGIYLEVANGHWYYIGFFEGRIKARSSESEFNSLVQSKKGKIVLADSEEAQLFRVNFLRKYRGEIIDILPNDTKIEDDPFKKKKKEEEEEKKDGF